MTKFNEMKGSELVAAYNEMAKKLGAPAVTRFSDRKAALRWCEALAARLPKEETKAKKNGAVRSSRATKVITAIVKGNPKKEGSLGAQHFDAMVGKTVASYLAAYEGHDRQNARQWLANFCRDQFVQLV